MPEVQGAFEGIAAGMRAGLDAYSEERRYQDSLKEKDYQRKMDRARMVAAGFDPDTMKPTAEAIADKRNKYTMEARAAHMRLKQGGDANDFQNGYEDDPTYAEHQKLENQSLESGLMNAQVQKDPLTGQPIFNSAIAKQKKDEANQQFQNELQMVSAKGSQLQRDKTFENNLPVSREKQAELSNGLLREGIQQGQVSFDDKGRVVYGAQPQKLNPDGTINLTDKDRKSLSHSEWQAAGFAKNAETAMASLNQLESSGYNAADKIPSARRGAPFGGALGITNKQDQLQSNSEENFINAVLRVESGSAIGTQEYQKRQRQLMPQTGDTPEVLAQKKILREQEVNNLRMEGGKAYLATPSAAKDAAMKAPQATGLLGRPDQGLDDRQEQTMGRALRVGQEMKGYVFLGGDPSDKASWKKK